MSNALVNPSQNPTTVIMKAVQEQVAKRTLVLPPDYSPENALKSAYLLLQEVVDKDKKPALQVCTPASISNALFSMVIQGLNPDKKQNYFIVYGNQLLCQRSYFGDEALAQRAMPGIHIYHSVIYDGDEIQIRKEMGSYGLVSRIVSHVQPFPRKSNEIIGAYCGVVDENGEDMGVEIMDWDQIQKSWGQSKTANYDNSTHKKFPDQMAIRTVVRRRLKPIINSSSDEMLLRAVRSSDLDAIDAEITEDEVQSAHMEHIELPAPTTEPEPAPEPAKAKAAKQSQSTIDDEQKEDAW